MTKDEALDLALEALDWISRVNAMDYEYQQKAKAAITAIKQARALDKKAENARELGLDYEPVPENFMDALRFDVAARDVREWERVDMRDHAEGNLGIGTAQPAPVQPVARS